MDAFAISVCKGLNMKKLNLKQGFIIAFMFGLFQLAMPIIGYFFCSPFEGYIKNFDHWIIFGLLSFIGIKMIIDCIKENRRPEFDEYFATTMASVGILAHRSILNGNQPYKVPDFRCEEDRVKFENDHLTPFYGANGEAPTLSACSDPNYVPSEAKRAAYETALNS